MASKGVHKRKGNRKVEHLEVEAAQSSGPGVRVAYTHATHGSQRMCSRGRGRVVSWNRDNRPTLLTPNPKGFGNNTDHYATRS